MENNFIDINKLHLCTARLSNIPPTESDMEKYRKHQEWLKKEGKREVIICCKNTIEVIRTIAELGITQREFDILKNSLHGHPLDRFGRNKFKDKATREIDLDKLINEVFEIASLFERKDVEEYFINNFYSLVQKENPQPRSAITLAKFNKKWKQKIADRDNIQNEVKQESIGIQVINNQNNMKIDNLNISGGNQQFADVINNNNSTEFNEVDTKIISLINEYAPTSESKENLYASLTSIKNIEESELEKKKSGNRLKTFLDTITTEGGKQLVKEIFEKGGDYFFQ